MGCLLYLAFLTAMAPASTLFWLGNRFASPNITVRATTGTLWSGEAQDVSFTPPDGHVISLERLAWNIHPLGLALGRLPSRSNSAALKPRAGGN